MKGVTVQWRREVGSRSTMAKHHQFTGKKRKVPQQGSHLTLGILVQPCTTLDTIWINGHCIGGQRSVGGGRKRYLVLGDYDP